VGVIVDGRLVVDLWAGWADAERTRPWRGDTVVNVFSAGKALAALCVLRLVDRGRLELDEPVARRWPEFAAGGKGDVTVRMVLSHRAGMAAIREQMPEPGALYDRARLVRALAEQEPWWEPGTAHGYHVQTFGLLAGELVRRAAGEPIADLLRREVAEPLGADVSFGLAARDRHRRADYVFGSETARRPPGPVSELTRLAYLNPPLATGLGTVNTVDWQEAELPSSNAHASARGLAAVYASLLDAGPEALAAETLDQAIEEASAGPDLVLHRPSRFGLGFQLTQAERPLGPNPRAFGHFGVGGSLGFADPDARVAFAYAMNRGGPRWQNPRNRVLIDALYESL
jgi:CubicO group peptidase (beta-lactamase class C family)